MKPGLEICNRKAFKVPGWHELTRLERVNAEESTAASLQCIQLMGTRGREEKERGDQ